jgi:YD repeat-containing protein
VNAHPRFADRNRVGYEQTYFEFDANGNRTAMADQQGRWEFTFDSLDRVTNRADPASKSFEWAYDSPGQRAHVL